MLLNNPMTVSRWQELKKTFRTMRSTSYVPEYSESHERSLNHRYYR